MNEHFPTNSNETPLAPPASDQDPATDPYEQSPEAQQAASERQVIANQIDAMMVELQRIEARKNTVIDSTSSFLTTKIGGELRQFQENTHGAPIQSREFALRVARDLEQVHGQLRGTQAAETEREELARVTQVALTAIEHSEANQQGADLLRKVEQRDERGDTETSAELTEIRRFVSNLAANIYGRPAGAILNDIKQLTTRLEAQTYRPGMKNDLVEALRLIQAGLRQPSDTQ